MIRILPDVQVSPLGGVMMWLLIAIVAVGIVLSAGPGGAIVWAIMWLVALAILFTVLKKIGGGVT